MVKPMTDSVFVYLHPLPDGIDEAVMTCFEGYTVYIDPNQSKEGILRSYRHAMEHIENRDFEKPDVQLIETEVRTHEGMKEVKLYET